MDNWKLFDTAINSKTQDGSYTKVLLWGPKGVAKSTAALNAASETHQGRVFQVALNDDIAVQELAGHYIPQPDGGFQWHDGPAIHAYRHGHALILNEISRASGAVQDFCLSLLDNPAVSMISLPNGEHVRPAAAFRVIATANHDPSGMDEALADRFDAILHIDTPHPALIAHLNSRYPALGDIVLASYADPERAISPRRALSFLTFYAASGDIGISCQIAFNGRGADIAAALKLAGSGSHEKPSAKEV